VLISFFEIYGGNCYDLLAGRKPLKVLEDGKGEVNVIGMVEQRVKNTYDVLTAIDKGTRARCAAHA
jgi:kinesin family protein 2/24